MKNFNEIAELSPMEKSMSQIVGESVHRYDDGINNGVFHSVNKSYGIVMSYQIIYNYIKQKWVIQTCLHGISVWQETNLNPYLLWEDREQKCLLSED